MRMAAPVRMRVEILEGMLAHARREPEMECCGILAGRDGVITTILPARNALASSTAYEIAPQELFTMFRSMRAQGLDHMGIYHSHPATENAPSPRDIDLAAYPETPYLIISPRRNARREVRAFSIRDGRVEELDILVVNG